MTKPYFRKATKKSEVPKEVLNVLGKLHTCLDIHGLTRNDKVMVALNFFARVVGESNMSKEGFVKAAKLMWEQIENNRGIWDEEQECDD